MKYDSGLCKRFGNDAEDVRVPEIDKIRSHIRTPCQNLEVLSFRIPFCVEIEA